MLEWRGCGEVVGEYDVEEHAGARPACEKGSAGGFPCCDATEIGG